MLLFGTVVVLGTLLPLSVLNRAPAACPDTLIEASEESAQLAVLAQLAQQNEELLRGLANSDNVSSLTGKPTINCVRQGGTRVWPSHRQTDDQLNGHQIEL